MFAIFFRINWMKTLLPDSRDPAAGSGRSADLGHILQVHSSLAMHSFVVCFGTMGSGFREYFEN